jgi:AcrR family transcriptional regulator
MEPLVAHSEREWILVGMAESCAVLGFEKTTIEDVCAAAGVSRPSFEKLFADLDECLAAAMESLLGEAWRRVEASHVPAEAWAAKVRDGVGALLDLFAERPAFARMALIEAPGAGGRAGELYSSCRAAALDYIERGREQGMEEAGIPASAGRAALAGAEALIGGQILAGDAERLGELAPDIVYMLAVPYLGRAEARRLGAGPPRRGHLRAVA